MYGCTCTDHQQSAMTGNGLLGILIRITCSASFWDSMRISLLGFAITYVLSLRCYLYRAVKHIKLCSQLSECRMLGPNSRSDHLFQHAYICP